jgi:hypothetical protein
MDGAFLIPVTWLMQAGIAFVPLAFIVPLSRKRVHWWWESLALILPYGVFLALTFFNFTPTNPLNRCDSIAIGFAVPIAALVRVVVGTRIDQQFCAARLMSLLCAVAAILYFMAPVVHDSM